MHQIDRVADRSLSRHLHDQSTGTGCQRPRGRPLIAGTPALRRTAEIPYAMLSTHGLAESDLTDAVRLLRVTFHGYRALESAGGFGAPRDVRKSWDRAVDALHVALTYWPHEEKPDD